MPNTVIMRNVRTGELRPVEAESDEFIELKQARYEHAGSPKPEWEQTGEHHARRAAADAEDGALQEPDAGYDHKPFGEDAYDVRDVGPEPAPHTALTPAEVEAGLTSEQKAKELETQFRNDKARAKGSAIEEATKAVADSPIEPAPAADQDEDDGKDRPRRRSKSASQNKGQRSRAGGSEGEGEGNSGSEE